MTPTIELNIRLDSKTGANTAEAFDHRKQTGVGFLGQYGAVSQRVLSFSPRQVQILILSVKTNDIPHAALFELAEVMLQDCISVFYPDRGEGLIVGPRSFDWAAFDLEKFHRRFDTISRDEWDEDGDA